MFAPVARADGVDLLAVDRLRAAVLGLPPQPPGRKAAVYLGPIFGDMAEYESLPGACSRGGS